METHIIFGPPGTGKTTRLLNIVKKELKRVQPERIAYVSFTKKGAYEGRARIREELKIPLRRMPNFRTLHSIAYREMGLSRGDMIEDHPELMRKFSERMNMKFTGYYTEDFRHSDDRYLFFDYLHRNNPKLAVNYLLGLNEDLLRWVRRNYRNFKNVVGFPDFTDIIQEYCKGNSYIDVDVAIVDEAQDLTTLQWEMVWKAFRGCKRIYIAGDDDQAIYEWSGADVSYFKQLKGEYEILSHSYRLPKAVHEYSCQITDMIEDRVLKDYTDNGTVGELHRIISYRELKPKPNGTWLFLARNNWHLKDIESWLKEEGYLYTLKGKLSLGAEVYKAVKRHSEVYSGKREVEPEDNQYIGFFCKEEPDYSVPWYEAFDRLKPATINYARRVIGAKHSFDDVYIALDTIHGIKGGEADNVVLLTDINKAVSTNLNHNKDSEMRCYYVGVTRARKRLFIVEPSGRYSFPIMEG